MEYKDEDGNVLHGYSAHDLAELIKHQRRNNALLMWIIMVMFMFFLLSVYLLWQIESRNILANALTTLAGC